MLVDWNYPQSSIGYSDISHKFIFLRNIQELDATISELQDLQDVGAMYNNSLL